MNRGETALAGASRRPVIIRTTAAGRLACVVMALAAGGALLCLLALPAHAASRRGRRKKETPEAEA